MNWDQIRQKVDEVVKAHDKATPREMAKLVQLHLQDEPILGWLVLDHMGHGEFEDEPKPQATSS